MNGFPRLFSSAAAALLILSGLASLGQDCRDRFVPTKYESGLVDLLGDGVFWVHSGAKSLGTAYLIDERGYLLTAAHVIEQYKNRLDSVEVRNQQKKSSRISKLIVHPKRNPNDLDDPYDVALLIMDSPPKVQSLDIATYFPTHDVKQFLMSLGFPEYPLQSPQLKPLEARFSTITEQGLIEVNQTTVEGNSGGPLIDSYGNSIGVLKRYLLASQNIGRYVSLFYAQELLISEIPPSPSILGLENEMSNGKLTLADFVSSLQKKGSGNPSNLDLVLWIYKDGQKLVDNPKIGKFLPCLEMALVDRNLLEAAFYLGRKVKVQSVLRTAIGIQMGMFGLKSGDFETAIEAAEMALGTTSRIDERGRARLLLGTALLKSGKPADADIQLKEALGELSASSQPTEYATTLATLAEVGILAGDLPSAISRLENSLSIFSGTDDSTGATRIRLRLANLYEKDGHYSKAAAHLEAAAQEFASRKDGEDEAEAWNQLAGLKIKQGDREGALAAANKSIALLPDPSNQKHVAAILGTQFSAQQAQIASDNPLVGLPDEGFWGRINPFARKEYVQRQTQPIRDSSVDLDELTAGNSKMINDVDSRAQEGIVLASAKADQADQHAIDASNRAEAARQTAQEATARLQTVEQAVANIDLYEPSAETEIRFRVGQTVLGKAAKEALDEMAAPLKNQRGYIVEVQGFSSGRGQVAIASSQKMADSVVRYLVLNHDIPVYRIYVVGMGNAPTPPAARESKPKLTTGGRVEIRLLRTNPKTADELR